MIVNQLRLIKVKEEMTKVYMRTVREAGEKKRVRELPAIK